jgi:hypothetical protein
MHARVFDHAGPSGAGDNVPVRIAFRNLEYVGIRNMNDFVAQWLAYMYPYRRFVAALTDDHARLGADVVRYSFIVVDSHHLHLAGIPAHPNDVLGPPGDQFFVTEVKGVLEIKQSGHEPDRQAWPACCTDSGAGNLQARAKEIAAGYRLASAVLACKGRCQGGFNLRPRQPVCQHGKRVSQVDHLVKSGSEKIVSCHLRCPPFPSGFSKAYSSFSEIAMGEFAVNSLLLQGFYGFAWPTN